MYIQKCSIITFFTLVNQTKGDYTMHFVWQITNETCIVVLMCQLYWRKEWVGKVGREIERGNVKRDDQQANQPCSLVVRMVCELNTQCYLSSVI